MKIDAVTAMQQIRADRQVAEGNDRWWANHARRQTAASFALEGRKVPSDYVRPPNVDEFVRTRGNASNE